MTRTSGRAGGGSERLQQPQQRLTRVEPETQERTWRALLRQFRPAIVLTLALTLIVGMIYPVVTTGVAQALFPARRMARWSTSTASPSPRR